MWKRRSWSTETTCCCSTEHIPAIQTPLVNEIPKVNMVLGPTIAIEMQRRYRWGRNKSSKLLLTGGNDALTRYGKCDENHTRFTALIVRRARREYQLHRRRTNTCAHNRYSQLMVKRLGISGLSSSFMNMIAQIEVEYTYIIREDDMRQWIVPYEQEKKWVSKWRRY